MLQERNFWTILLLSIITCGIYNLFYVFSVTEDLNTLAGNDGKEINPTTTVLLWIFTCGIYPLIWYYMQGNRIQEVARNNNIHMDENGTTYLVWILVGVLLAGIGPLIAQYLMIENVNKLVFAYNSRNISGTQK